MARGFATGLFHGALAGAVGLTALSLLLPAPQGRQDAAMPDATVIGTPTGSEFGRGEDAQPLLPAPLTRPTPAPLGGAAAVDAPAEGGDAPLADASTTTAERPETRAEDPLAPPDIAPITVDADLPAAPQNDGRVVPPAPERFESPVPDAGALPMVPSQSPTEDASEATTESPSETSTTESGLESGPDRQAPDAGEGADAAPMVELPIVRPGLPLPPAAEAPADMSALTRGRPEDGLDDTVPAQDSQPVDEGDETPVGAASEQTQRAPSPASGTANRPETAPEAATATTPDAPAPDERADDTTAGDDPATDGFDAVESSPVSAAEQDETATAPPADILPSDDGSTQPAAEAAPAEDGNADRANADRGDLDGADPDGEGAGSRMASPATGGRPAMNLSTPPDIGGLLARQ